MLEAMTYHVLALTLAQVRQGGLEFQRQMSVAVREEKELKVYSASPFDLEARRKLKERFGGDVVYFFNQAARDFCQRHAIDVEFVGEISEQDLPKRRTVVVGMPE
jgi:hypothetical protein